MVLALVDCVSSAVFPPVVVQGEDEELAWDHLFMRAKAGGLLLPALRDVMSDGNARLLAYLRSAVHWVNHQRCVLHVWQGLGRELRQVVLRATAGMAEDVAKATGKALRRELAGLIRAVVDAKSYADADAALAKLAAHEHGAGLARSLKSVLDALLVHLQDCN